MRERLGPHWVTIRTTCDECGKFIEFPPSDWWKGENKWVALEGYKNEYRHEVILIREGWITNKTIDFQRCDFCCQKCYEKFLSRKQ